MTTLTAPGWKIPEDAELNDAGNIEFSKGETKWEVDPETGASRHCGTEPGCFWTEWED